MRMSSVRPSRGHTPSSALRRTIAMLACCTAWAAIGTARTADALGAQAATQREAVLVGSSSFAQPFGFVIAHQLERWGYRVARKGVPGAGLARPDFRDMNRVLDTLPISAKTDVVVVYLGVNDAQSLWLYPEERELGGAAMLPFGTPAWEARYEGRALNFYQRICERGARRAIVLLPVDVDRPQLEQRLKRVRELQLQAAARSSCASVLSTAGDAASFEARGLARRLADGFHLSPYGADLVWERIRGHVLALLSLSSRGTHGHDGSGPS
jgi:hypothetical protein